ncbi:MAG: hypothetical protein M3Y65_25210 [Pseudomonadota bacterium]|nr:hypothetical protein [Pseudomonadota bacterium]
MLPAPAIAAILTPFVAWRVYQRVRRLMVRQQSHAWRHWLSIAIMGVLVVVFGVMTLGHPLAVAALAAGVAVGVGLSLLALQRTRFERIGSNFFFVPHAPIGAIVSLLFIGRLLYRGYEFYVDGAAASAHFTSTPLTMIVFGIMAGYYANFARGVLRWRADNKETTV